MSKARLYRAASRGSADHSAPAQAAAARPERPTPVTGACGTISVASASVANSMNEGAMGGGLSR